MEKVFKTKRTRNWWIIIVGLVVLIIFLNVYLEKSWAFSALGGIIIPVLMFYSRSKTMGYKFSMYRKVEYLLT